MVENARTLARKGRGTLSNAAGRFERFGREIDDDGWGTIDEDLPPLRTSVTIDGTRSIIAKNDSPDIPFEQSINPYRGCEHGCVYCFARPTHAWLGLSPGQDFESKLFAKPDAPALLRKALANPRYRCSVIAMGTNTDPYQPIERDMRVTRGILEVLRDARHPVSIVTKSALVARDADILGEMAGRKLVKVFLSVTTLDPDLARHMEPRAATPGRRLKTMTALAEAGIPVGVMVAPIIPGLNDHEIEAILERAKQAGAGSAGRILLRLPLEIKDLFQEWLGHHYPDRSGRVLSLIRETRDGALYKKRWGERMTGTGPVADMIAARFDAASRRLGLDRNDWTLDTTRFERPSPDDRQLDLI